MREFAVWWYGLLNSVFSIVGVPLRDLVAGGGSSLVAAWEPWLRGAAGFIFLLVGINDTVLYWFL